MPGEIRSVGFIGLGRVGAAMAHNILKAGFDLTVYNRTPEKMKPLLDRGAGRADTPGEAAARTDVVVTCLLDDRSMLETVTGGTGILAGLRPAGIHIGTATISPACAAQLAELHRAHGSHYVAGPVVGRIDAAEAGTLRTYVAGDPAVIGRCQRLFAAYAQDAVNVGANHPVANSVKLTINYMALSLIELMGQVYAFAEKSGIESQFAHDLIVWILGHPAPRQYAQKVRKREFDEVGFALAAGFKDLQLMLQASTDTRVALSYANIIREKFLAALAHGMGDRDWSAISEITRMNAGLP